MTKKVYFLLIFLSCSFLSLCSYADDGKKSREVLLRLPYLSMKSGKIISNALEKVNGITTLEACYELRVLIIKYDGDLIINDSVIIDVINRLDLNITVEKIYNSDIPIIENNYSVTNLLTIENKTQMPK